MSTVIFISIGFFFSVPSLVFSLFFVFVVVYLADISFDAQLSSFVLPR